MIFACLTQIDANRYPRCLTIDSDAFDRRTDLVAISEDAGLATLQAALDGSHAGRVIFYSSQPLRL